MFEDLLGAYGSRLVIAVVGVGAALLLLIGTLWMIRGRSGPSPFVRGGKNRQPRLQVLDAAAVDTRRRLVLVRRDNVEHLVMIGGPTDIVIESGIPARPAQATRQENLADATERTAPSAAGIQNSPRHAPSQPLARGHRIEPAVETTGPRAVSRPLAAAASIDTGAIQVASPSRQGQNPTAGVLRPGGTHRPEQTSLQPGREGKPLPGSTGTTSSGDKQQDGAHKTGERPTPEQPALLIPQSARPIAGPVTAIESPKQLGGDFDRILEQEMANNLAAVHGPSVPEADRLPIARGSAAGPGPGDGGHSPALQSDSDPIFGDMAAKRDS